MKTYKHQNLDEREALLMLKAQGIREFRGHDA